MYRHLSGWLLAASLALLTPALAQSSKPAPMKTTVKTCGAYQIKLSENGFEEPLDTVSIVRGGKTYVKFSDVGVGMDTCTDLTGDGVPEVVLSQYSGGAHCCTVAQVYSLTTPPRQLLAADLADSDGFEVVQLDTGAKELWTGDWRFAYAFDLSFADSPALPLIFGYRGGRYVDVTRDYPQVILKGLKPSPKDEWGDALYTYAAYIIAGQPQKAAAYLEQLNTRNRAWLENYAPDIRQSLLSVGLTDWPQRAGVAWENANWGIGGSFSKAGTQEYLATVKQGKSSSLRLFSKRGETVSLSPALVTFPTPPQQSSVGFDPRWTVYRATGRDDAVVRDSLSGTVTYRAYRVGASNLTELKNDPLARAAALLAQLDDLGSKRAHLYSSSVKTQAQRQTILKRIAAAQAKAQGWQKVFVAEKTPLALDQLGVFSVQSIEVSRESASSALVAGVVEMGNVAPDQSSEYVLGKRYTFAIFLEKQDGQWKVTRWQLTPREGGGPMTWFE